MQNRVREQRHQRGLSQAELAAALAQASGISVTLLTSAALIAATGALVARSRPSGPPG